MRPELCESHSCETTTTGADGKKRKRPAKRKTRTLDLPHPDDIPEAEETVSPEKVKQYAEAVVNGAWEVREMGPGELVDSQPKPSGNKQEVDVAAREVVSTVQALLRLSPGVEHMEPLVNALDEAQSLCEEYMSA